MQNALEATKVEFKRKIELKNILVAHDVEAFKKFFVEKEFPEIFNKIKGMDDTEVSDLMHFYKTTMPFLGQDFYASRNHLRLKSLKEQLLNSKDLVTDDLRNYIEKNSGNVPSCASCRYYQTPPEGEDKSCMQMFTAPSDVACIGWTVIEN